MLEFLHGAPYAVCVELKNLYLFVFVLEVFCLFWRSFVCFGGLLFVSCMTVYRCGWGWWWGCEELGWVLLEGLCMGVCVMGICGGSRDV